MGFVDVVLIILLALVLGFMLFFLYKQRKFKLLQQCFDSSPSFIEIWDREYNLVDCNKKSIELFGVSSPKEFIKRYEEFSPEFQPCGTSSMDMWIAYSDRAFREGRVRFEWMHLTATGEPLPVETTFVRLNEHLIMGYNHDLREIKGTMARQHELEMKQQEQKMNERIRVMFNATPMIIDYWNKDFEVVDCNEYALNFYGFTSKADYLTQDLITMPDEQSNGAPSLNCRNEQLKKIFDEGHGKFEFEEKKISGEMVCVEVEGISMKDESNDEQIVITYSKDITLLKDIEAREIERQAAMLTQKLLDNSPMFIKLWDTEGNLIHCSDKILNALEITDKETFMATYYHYSTPMQSGLPVVDYNKRMINTALEKGITQGEWTFLLPSGEELPTETTWVQVLHQDKSMVITYSMDMRPMRAAIEAEESNAAKTRFLARMSHEIRTPIAAVLGISEMQIRNHAMPPQTEEAFFKIYDSSKMLLNIVNDILDLSKIESGKMTFTNNEYEVSGLISNASQLYTVYSDQKDISFKLLVDENLPKKLIGDEFRIRQIITNLLTNAFKYTDNGTVTLSLCAEEGEMDFVNLVITIQDTGLGMSQQQIDQLNEDYVRFHAADKPYISGTGLGIPIVFSLAKMMDASIDLTSEVGVGTLVRVSIPQGASGTEVMGKAYSEGLQSFETTAWSFAGDFTFVPEPVPPGRVLVVDDVDTNLYVAEAMLTSFGLDVTLCERAQEAIDQIKSGIHYDIIFMDHMMPEMDGMEATKILREMGCVIPIVAITANAIKGHSDIYLQNGFSGFMAKPMDIKLLNAYLLRFL